MRSLLLTACLGAAAWGQLYTGSLSGTVLDPSGAPVSGAHVTVIGIERSSQAEAHTDGSGRYLFRSIDPGRYSIQVEAVGFDPIRFDGIVVDVSANLSADARLRVQRGARACWWREMPLRSKPTTRLSG